MMSTKRKETDSPPLYTTTVIVKVCKHTRRSIHEGLQLKNAMKYLFHIHYYIYAFYTLATVNQVSFYSKN